MIDARRVLFGTNVSMVQRDPKKICMSLFDSGEFLDGFSDSVMRSISSRDEWLRHGRSVANGCLKWFEDEHGRFP